MALIRCLKDLPVEGRRVLLRVDLDVPMDDESGVLDDSRIHGLLATIQELRRREARIVIASGMGKPKGKREVRWSLEPIAARIAELLEAREDEVVFSEEPVGDGPRHQAHSLKDGHILILENLRFHSGELGNEDSFSRALASMAEVYVNDSFASMNRVHASTVGVTKYLRERATGLLVEKELAGLKRLTEKPQRPLVAIVGGSRLADMGSLLLALVPQVDVLCVGGEMSLALLWAKGQHVGHSAPDAESLGMAEKILRRVDKREAMQLVLPVDFVGGGLSGSDFGASSQAVELFRLGSKPVDVGEKTVELFRGAVERSKTVFWSGSLGIGENGGMDRGTSLIGKAIARSNAYSVVGGPDSLASIRKAGVAPFIHHLSAGGESALWYIEGRVLPGLAALAD